MSAGVYAGHLRTGPLLAEYSNVSGLLYLP